MENNVISMESSQYVISEIKRQLPRIAKILKTTVDQLKISDYSLFPSAYMKSPFRDPVIETTGIIDGLPIIQKRRLQMGGQGIGIGIFIHKSYLNPEINYAIYTFRGPMWDESYMICKKGDLYRLKRNALSLNRKSSDVNQAPILPDGLLEEIIQNTVGFLRNSKEIEKFGIKIKRGIILDGPPGNGKSMVCRYIQKLCAQHGISWGVVTSSDIDEAYNEKTLSDLFNAFTVSFFDDIDISYMDRSKGNGKMACSLLTAMDGMSDSDHLVRIFTTNERVDSLDKAFIRPGRIDKCITIEKPNEKLREKLIQSWPKEIVNNINVQDLIERSNNFSFAELESIRTFLVTNKVVGNSGWNLDKAFNEFHDRQAGKKHVKFGFSEK